MPDDLLIDNPNISARRTGPVVVATLKTNKVSDFEAAHLRPDLIKAAGLGSAHLAIDLAAVEMLTSAGIGLIIELQRHCAGGGGKLILFGLQDDVLGVLKVTRLDRILTIRPDEAAALATLR